MIGLKRGTVQLCEHEKEWEIEAQNTIARLKEILGDVIKDIQHVGSEKTIRNNGGVYESPVYESGKNCSLKRFWITL